MYILRLSEEEINKLVKEGSVIIDDKIETDCDQCSYDIDFEIQLIKKD